MGYGLKAYWETFLILTGIKAEKIMEKKADEVRDLLTNGASTVRIVLAIMGRCKKKYPGKDRWPHAAISQTQHVLDIPIAYARALVSEYSGVKTT